MAGRDTFGRALGRPRRQLAPDRSCSPPAKLRAPLVELGARDIRPIIISRGPASYIRSLLKRGDVAPLARQLSVEPAVLALEIWKSYTRVLVAIARETECYVSYYEWFLDEDLARGELERAAAYLQLGLIDTAPALEWLDPNAMHHGAESSDDGVDAEAAGLHDQLMAEARAQRRAWDDLEDPPLADSKTAIQP